MKKHCPWIGEGLKEAAPILLITGAGGAFGKVISNSGVAELIKNMNMDVFGTGALPARSILYCSCIENCARFIDGGTCYHIDIVPLLPEWELKGRSHSLWS